MHALEPTCVSQRMYIILGNDVSEEGICEWISEKSMNDRYQFAFSKFFDLRLRGLVLLYILNFD